MSIIMDVKQDSD